MGGDRYTCTCLPDFIGNPPNCRPECVWNSECAHNLACINRHCRDPCSDGLCGVNAICKVVSHTPICECSNGYVGDPFNQCSIKEPPQLDHIDPCNPSPCAANAVCRIQNGVGSCQCLPDYFGDPYDGCRPECTLNSDCASNKACIRNKCVDPCPGMCPQNANCQVVNHLPTCVCRAGYTGDSYRYCSLIPDNRKSLVHESLCLTRSQCNFMCFHSFLKLFKMSPLMFVVQALVVLIPVVAIIMVWQYVLVCLVSLEALRLVGPSVSYHLNVR